MPRTLVAVVVLMALLGSLGESLAAPEKRVALVVGNGAYRTVPALTNPPNDARAVAAVLNGLEFDVELALDTDRSGLEQALRRFGKRLGGAGVGLFFYAGHGLQVSEHNYLVPVDADIDSEQSLPFATIDLEVVLRQMEGASRVNLIFLDACRDNPMAKNLARTLGTRSVAIGRGLSRIEEAPEGTLIAYSTAPGTVAEDGSGTHSAFSAALIKDLATPGLSVHQVMIRVRQSVKDATGGKQIPWDHSSLTSDLYLQPEAAPVVDGQPAGPVVPKPAVAAGADATEMEFWDSIKSSTNPADYRAYLEAYPNGHFAPLARVRADEQRPVAMAEGRSLAARPAAGADDRARREAEALAKVGQLPLVVIQYALKALGHYDGTVDGAAGNSSSRAIKAFQKDLGATPDGVLKPEQTVALIQQAAGRGQAESQTTLGMMLASGIGVVSDEAAAVGWLRRAASQGNVTAKYNLALLIRDGRGTGANRDDALRLLREAKAAGHQKAEAALKEMEK